MKQFLIASAVLAVSSTASFAQSGGIAAGNVGVTYEYLELDGQSGDAISLNGDVAFDITPRFGIQTGANYTFRDSIDNVGVNLHLYTRFGSSKAGAFVGYENFSIDSGGTAEALSYGVEAMIDGGTVDYELRVGQQRFNQLGSSTNLTFAGASIFYDYGQNLTFVGGLKYSDIDVVDFYQFAVGADYYINQKFKLAGRVGYNYATGSGSGSLSGALASISLSYEFGGRKDRLFGGQSPVGTLATLSP
ncbi:hypothetical protein [Halovulum sp. GXIMD14793]